MSGNSRPVERVVGSLSSLKSMAVVWFFVAFFALCGLFFCYFYVFASHPLPLVASLPSFGWFPHSHIFACHVLISLSILAALPSAFRFSCFISCFSYFVSSGS